AMSPRTVLLGQVWKICRSFDTLCVLLLKIAARTMNTRSNETRSSRPVVVRLGTANGKGFSGESSFVVSSRRSPGAGQLLGREELLHETRRSTRRPLWSPAERARSLGARADADRLQGHPEGSHATFPDPHHDHVRDAPARQRVLQGRQVHTRGRDMLD